MWLSPWCQITSVKMQCDTEKSKQHLSCQPRTYKVIGCHLVLIICRLHWALNSSAKGLSGMPEWVIHITADTWKMCHVPWHNRKLYCCCCIAIISVSAVQSWWLFDGTLYSACHYHGWQASVWYCSGNGYSVSIGEDHFNICLLYLALWLLPVVAKWKSVYLQCKSASSVRFCRQWDETQRWNIFPNSKQEEVEETTSYCRCLWAQTYIRVVFVYFSLLFNWVILSVAKFV